MSADQAATTILKSAGPCQFDVVAETVQKLGKDALSSGWMEPLKGSNDADRCIGIDRTTDHPLAAALRKELETYQDQVFGSKSNVASRIAMAPGDSTNAFKVHTYAEKLDRANQFAGAWKATWDIVSESSGSATIAGVVSIRTHSYEEGNSQLRTSKNFPPEQVRSKDLTAALVDKIVAYEREMIAFLASLHEQTADSLRSIRRILPITKTRMKWDVVAHRNVKTLRVTAK